MCTCVVSPGDTSVWGIRALWGVTEHEMASDDDRRVVTCIGSI